MPNTETITEEVDEDVTGIATDYGVTTYGASTEINEEEPDEQEYLLFDLIINCEALGYRKEIVIGAFFGYAGMFITKARFAEIIAYYLGKKAR